MEKKKKEYKQNWRKREGTNREEKKEERRNKIEQGEIMNNEESEWRKTGRETKK